HGDHHLLPVGCVLGGDGADDLCTQVMSVVERLTDQNEDDAAVAYRVWRDVIPVVARPQDLFVEEHASVTNELVIDDLRHGKVGLRVRDEYVPGGARIVSHCLVL